MPRGRQTSFWTDEKDQILRDFYFSEGPKGCAIRLGKSEKSVQVRAARLKLNMDPAVRFAQMAHSRAENSETCDWDYFNRDWSPNLAYLVGYIWADGSIDDFRGIPRTLKFGCHTQDRDILEQIRIELKSNHALTDRPPKVQPDGTNAGPSTSLQISNHLLVKPLVERFGIVPRKSYLDPPYPNNIPDELLGHFSRGVLDGDGGFYDGVYGWRGSNKFMTGLRDQIVDLLSVERNSVCQEGTIFAIRWGAVEDVKKLYRFLYPPGNYLAGQRKRSKASNWMLAHAA